MPKDAPVKNKKQNQKQTQKSTASKSSMQKNVPAKVKHESTVPTVCDKILPFVFVIIGAFFALCFVFPGACGAIGCAVRDGIFGTFGAGALPIPVFLIFLGIFYLKFLNAESERPRAKIYIRSVLGTLSVASLSSFLSIVFFGYELSLTSAEMFENGKILRGGGVLGGVIAEFLCKYIGIFALFLLFLSTVLLVILTFGFTPYRIYDIIKDKKAAKADIDDDLPFDSEDGEDDDDLPEIIVKEPKKPKKEGKAKNVKRKDPLDHSLDIENDDDGDTDDDPIDNSERIDLVDNDGKKISTKHTPEEKEDKPGKKAFDFEEFDEKKTKKKAPPVISVEEKNPDSDFDLDEIFEDNSVVTPVIENGETSVSESEKTLKTEKITVGTSTDEMPDPGKPVYRLPPMSLLKFDENQQAVDVSADLEKNSRKLISTLASFNVNATVAHISRGPTITRYELKLAPGVRVTAISKLVDDIAMTFASTGVRIEAPIPGKDAVGVEVPNKDIRIVRIRELLDTDRFRKADSKLTCALGVDVVGEPVYLDIAKMPHMLVAGATGMGKSVCINSLLVSLLCKASPDDVRIMLIDPKKVEFVPYSEIPHLLVPVVTDPKKAAGALHWAVEEMERRYTLIEEVGCRNIFGYNEVTASDPEKEHLPQIVIVIDELADLMMTAKNDVESSICRIAQKARAAGMYLIIGTQRPSVDIVTGTIKANIPSRIACKTSSQVDSRTIIDVAGAEKLIGRGDMLYAPVGIAKPIRLQGAFVSDSEVEAVTSFIKKTYGKVSFDEGIKEKIDREASQINAGKQSAFDPFDSDKDGEEDEMLHPAIEFAFESGKVSTSLFQRKLSIGYGRAAKIIDRMEELGICSAPSGNKPRELLMTKEEYLEMMKGDNE